MPRSLKPPGTSEWRGILLLLQNLTQDKERFLSLQKEIHICLFKNLYQ